MHERNNRNPKDVANQVKDILLLPASPIPSLELFTKTLEALKIGDYSDAIFKLMELRDAKNGIFWRQDKQLTVRDARGVKDEPTYGFEAYAIMGINALRAAKALINSANVSSSTSNDNPLDKELKILSQVFLQSIQAAKDEAEIKEDLARFNKRLIGIVSQHLKIKPKEAAKRLNVAREFVQLEEEARTVVTVSNIQYACLDQAPSGTVKKTCTVMEGEIPLTKLTHDQSEEYANRKTKVWYKELPKWQQALVDSYAGKIQENNRVIPTQLRKSTVGLRNAYLKFTAELEDNGVVILNEHVHAGTLAHLGSDRERISLLNAEQLKARVNNQSIHVITLNSEYNIFNNDSNIVSLTKSAVSAIGSAYSNLAFNDFRRVMPNVYEGVIEQLQAVSEIAYHNNFFEVGHYLARNRGSFAAVMEKIKTIKESFDLSLHIDQHILELLEKAVECKNLIDNNASPIDEENRNLQIVVLSQRIGYLLNILFAKQEEEINKNNEINKSKAPTSQPSHGYQVLPVEKIITYNKVTTTHCQSGKDRNGLALFFNSAQNIVYSITRKISSAGQAAAKSATTKNDGQVLDQVNPGTAHNRTMDEEINAPNSMQNPNQVTPTVTHTKSDLNKAQSISQSVISQLACSGHTTFMAGYQGGSLGCFGIKEDTERAIPKSFLERTKQQLLLLTAGLNKKILEKTKSKSDKEYRIYQANHPENVNSKLLEESVEYNIKAKADRKRAKLDGTIKKMSTTAYLRYMFFGDRKLVEQQRDRLDKMTGIDENNPLQDRLKEQSSSIGSQCMNKSATGKFFQEMYDYLEQASKPEQETQSDSTAPRNQVTSTS